MKNSYRFQKQGSRLLYSHYLLSIILLIIYIVFSLSVNAKDKKHQIEVYSENIVADGFIKPNIKHDIASKIIRISAPDNNLVFFIDYNQGCRISELYVKGKNTLSASGVYTGFKTRGGSFSSNKTFGEIKVQERNNKVTLSNITYGDNAVKVNETWNIELQGDKIQWGIDRSYNTLAKLEEMALPQWNFADLSVWKGGIMDNGGMVWCKYL